MDIKGILFDKDGTLFDYYQTWMPLNREAARITAREDATLAHKLMEHGGWDPETDTIRAGSLLAAHTNREIAEGFLEIANGWDVEELTEVFNNLFATGGYESAVPVTDLPAFLDPLRAAGYALGVATSDGEDSAQAMLKKHGAFDLLDFVAGYDSGHGPKPGPGMAHAFCTTTGLTPSEIVMVGDNRHDMEMGRNAGVAFCIGVLTGTSNREELALEAEYVLDDVTGIPGLLAQLGSAV